MWTRKALKRQGRAAFKRNYWKSVLVALILLIVLNGSNITGKVRNLMTDREDTSISSVYDEEDPAISNGWEYKDDYQGSAGNGYSDDYFDNYFGGYGQSQIPQQLPQQEQKTDKNSGFSWEKIVSVNNGFTSILGSLVIVLIAAAAAILLRFFIMNPLELGAKRFFLMNLKSEPAEMREIGYAFDHSWKNVAYVLFFRDLRLALWSLLLVVPGIVKSYEYRMIPYLLAENPEMTKEDAFAESRRMMKGQKWQTFVLDFSFMGWMILSGLTGGIVGIFYTNPYIFSTGAALYAHLRYEYERTYQDPYYRYAYAGNSGMNPQAVTQENNDTENQMAGDDRMAPESQAFPDGQEVPESRIISDISAAPESDTSTGVSTGESNAAESAESVEKTEPDQNQEPDSIGQDE